MDNLIAMNETMYTWSTGSTNIDEAVNSFGDSASGGRQKVLGVGSRRIGIHRFGQRQQLRRHRRHVFQRQDHLTTGFWKIEITVEMNEW